MMSDPPPARFDGGAAFVDGAYVPLSEAKISLFDWGFTRSDATYDVASVWQGAFFRLNDHLDRFFASLAKLRFKIPYDRAQVREILHGCVRAGGLRDAYVAMVCTRGVPPRGARDPRLAGHRKFKRPLQGPRSPQDRSEVALSVLMLSRRSPAMPVSPAPGPFTGRARGPGLRVHPDINSVVPTRCAAPPGLFVPSQALCPEPILAAAGGVRLNADAAQPA